MAERWTANVTVAAIIERRIDGVSRFLLVEEETPEGLKLNNPAGIWVTDGGESKYELTLCGDGDDLCGKLIWSNDNDLGTKLKPYIGQMMLVNAPRVANQEWRAGANADARV